MNKWRKWVILQQQDLKVIFLIPSEIPRNFNGRLTFLLVMEGISSMSTVDESKLIQEFLRFTHMAALMKRHHMLYLAGKTVLFFPYIYAICSNVLIEHDITQVT